jgi:hypothetical protein
MNPSYPQPNDFHAAKSSATPKKKTAKARSVPRTLSEQGRDAYDKLVAAMASEDAYNLATKNVNPESCSCVRDKKDHRVIDRTDAAQKRFDAIIEKIQGSEFFDTNEIHSSTVFDLGGDRLRLVAIVSQAMCRSAGGDQSAIAVPILNNSIVKVPRPR